MSCTLTPFEIVTQSLLFRCWSSCRTESSQRGNAMYPETEPEDSDRAHKRARVPLADSERRTIANSSCSSFARQGKSAAGKAHKCIRSFRSAGADHDGGVFLGDTCDNPS
eukprot:7835927-Pyramimonas_sp.AAC.1